MVVRTKSTLRLVEIQESVLAEEEWIIGVSDPLYFGGVGFSMPLSPMNLQDMVQESDVEGGVLSEELDCSSNLDDSVKINPVEMDPFDELLPGTYKHGTDGVQASNVADDQGPHIEYPTDNTLLLSMQRGLDRVDLYAFIPGIFYCSSQQTSVDAVLIEVTQKEAFGMTLASFRPEDVRSFSAKYAMQVDASANMKRVGLSLSSLGSFSAKPIMTAASPSLDPERHTVELAIALAKRVPLTDLRHAYLASKFLESRLTRLLEDVEFYGLAPRNRIYIRNRKHPYGTVVDVRYRGLDSILDLEGESGISCYDEMDLTVELKDLSFSKPGEVMREVDVEAAIIDMLNMFSSEIGGKTDKEHMLKMLAGGDEI